MATALLGSLIPQAASAASPLIIEGKGDWLFPQWESLTDAGLDAIAGTIKTIDAVRRTLKAASIETLVLVVPMKARFYANFLPDGVRLSPLVESRYDAVIRELGAAGIATFDVAAVMRAITQPTFFRTDYHWTEWSAEAVAQACAARLTTLVALPPVTEKMPPLSPFSEDKHIGDLEELLPAARQKAIGEEAITIRTIDASRVTLLDSSKSDVHVVGNSFSMPYLGFPEMLAETLNRPVGVTAKFGNAGPWQTMLSYLESPVYKARKPRVVVWQFVEGALHARPGIERILGCRIVDERSNVSRTRGKGNVVATVSTDSRDWEDAATVITQHIDDRFAAAWVLRAAPFWRFARRGGWLGPIILGVALFAIVVAMIVLAPSAESHFIYTDF